MVDTGMQPEVVRTRLAMLETLLDDVDRQFPTLRTVQQRQGAAMWTDIPACEGFASEYVKKLGDLERGLIAIRGSVQMLLVNLAESAQKLTLTDEDIQARMISIVEKLNAMPVTVAPTATPAGGADVPTDAAAPGGYGSTMSGGGGYGSTLPA